MIGNRNLIDLIPVMRYELTVTSHPRLYDRDASTQFSIMKENFIQIMRPHKGSPGFLFSAVAELNGNNDVHIHAIVELNDLVARNRLLNRFRSKDYKFIFGRKTCTQLINEPVWIDYMRKDLKKTREIIGISPIIKDELSLLHDHQKEIDYYCQLEEDILAKHCDSIENMNLEQLQEYVKQFLK